MADLLWGNVHYKQHFAGYLRQEPGQRSSFTYHESYLAAKLPPISISLPLRSEPFIYQSTLPPFFDNLVAEGWLEEAQTRLLGRRQASRFELLLAFGQDCAGAISILDPAPKPIVSKLMDLSDAKELAAFTTRASLSGVQPKLTLIKRANKFFPTKPGEVSTYIAKFPSRHQRDLILNEYLSMLACNALLPEDDIAELTIDEIENFVEPALIIKRFDRDEKGEKIHFEEFNQLLEKFSFEKYDGSYKAMADFIRQTPHCIPIEVYRLYTRILAGLLLGNTDMHFKNFAMFHTPEGLRLTPIYDVVGAVLYQYKTVALAINHTTNLEWGNLRPTHLIRLGQEFLLSKPAIQMASEQLAQNLSAAKEAVYSAQWGSKKLKDHIISTMEKRWKGTFTLIGQILSKKP